MGQSKVSMTDLVMSSYKKNSMAYQSSLGGL